jgi:hypothetical protein
VEYQHPAGAFGNLLGDLVAMTRPLFHQRQDEQLGAPFFQFRFE